MIGHIKWYDGKKGYGFIRSPAHAQDIFFHHTGLARASLSAAAGERAGERCQLAPGDEVTFDIELPSPNIQTSNHRTRPPRATAVNITVRRAAPLRPAHRVTRTELNWEHIHRP